MEFVGQVHLQKGNSVRFSSPKPLGTSVCNSNLVSLSLPNNFLIGDFSLTAQLT